MSEGEEEDECPACGGDIRSPTLHDHQYTCPHCRTVLRMATDYGINSHWEWWEIEDE